MFFEQGSISTVTVFLKNQKPKVFDKSSVRKGQTNRCGVIRSERSTWVRVVARAGMQESINRRVANGRQSIYAVDKTMPLGIIRIAKRAEDNPARRPQMLFEYVLLQLIFSVATYYSQNSGQTNSA
jgi:hypothetical protein